MSMNRMVASQAASELKAAWGVSATLRARNTRTPTYAGLYRRGRLHGRLVLPRSRFRRSRNMPTDFGRSGATVEGLTRRVLI